MNKLAVGAAILGIASVVGADMMSRLAQEGALPTIIVVPSEPAPKRTADNAREAGLPMLALSLGVDMSATATIPSPAAASSCGAPGQAVLMTHSIGVDGTTVTPIIAPARNCGQSHEQFVSSDAN
ncbi:MAG: hypothetical protein WB816_01280 [Methylocystis sp.]